MTKVLVTGSTGMVGAHVCLHLLKHGYQVFAMHRSNSDRDWMRRIFSFNGVEHTDKIQFVTADLLDSLSLESVLKGMDVVVHCAAKVSFLRRDEKDLELFNHQGTTNLVNLCIHIPELHFIHISSVAALGRKENGLVNEQVRWKSYPDSSPYSITKYQAEMEVWRGSEEGINVTVLQPSYILGPGNWYTGSASLFRQVKKGLKYHTKAKMGFVDVRNVAEAVLQSIKQKAYGESFIINAENITYQQLLSKIALEGAYPPPSKQLNRGLLKMILPFLRFTFFLRGKTLPLNRYTLASLFSSKEFDNQKSVQNLGIQYYSIDDCIAHAWKFFKTNFKD